MYVHHYCHPIHQTFRPSTFPGLQMAEVQVHGQADDAKEQEDQDKPMVKPRPWDPPREFTVSGRLGPGFRREACVSCF